MGTLDGLILIHNSVFGSWKDQVRHQLMRHGTNPGSDDDRQSADGVVRLFSAERDADDFVLVEG